MNSLREAVIATIYYFSINDTALTAEEIRRYLYGWPEAVSLNEIQRELEENKNVVCCKGYWVLMGKEASVERRIISTSIESSFWIRVWRYVWFFEAVGHIRMAAVVNSLAFGTVKPTSDIDFLIITEPGKVAYVRTALKLLSQLYGIKVRGNDRAQKFCFSFIVDSEHEMMETFAHEYDPHLAYITAFTRPVYGFEYYKKWLQNQQPWLKHYFKRNIAAFSSEHDVHKNSVPRLHRSLVKMVTPLVQPFEEHRLRKYIEQLSQKEAILLSSGVSKLHEHDSRLFYAHSLSEFFFSTKSNQIAVP